MARGWHGRDRSGYASRLRWAATAFRISFLTPEGSPAVPSIAIPPCGRVAESVIPDPGGPTVGLGGPGYRAEIEPPRWKVRAGPGS